MKVRINEQWRELLQEEFDKPYFAELASFVRDEYAAGAVFPRAGNIFRAFDMCPPSELSVVIIGQDPYHDVNQANGLCFSVNDGVAFPPSLRNIFQEISNDLGKPVPQTGNLDRWAAQGVLLLNSVLTVRAHQPASHAGHGWETFTDAVVRTVSERMEHVVYMLWGAYAQRKGSIADPSRNLIIRTAHPSPLSAYRGFLGSRQFSEANRYLQSVGRRPIDW